MIVALVHGKPGNYGISFPDFPGCVAGGDTIDEAVARGREALSTHVETILDEGMTLPTPRTVDAIHMDPGFSDDLAEAVTVAALDFDLPSKSVRVNVSFDETLLKRIDRAAQASGETRSGFLAGAARERLRR